MLPLRVQGAAKPDISSADALRRTLLQAKSIAYLSSVSGRYLASELFQRLGIAAQIMGKSRRIEGERVVATIIWNPPKELAMKNAE